MMQFPTPGKVFMIVEIAANSDTHSPYANVDVVRRNPANSANFLFVDGHVAVVLEPVPGTEPRWRW